MGRRNTKKFLGFLFGALLLLLIIWLIFSKLIPVVTRAVAGWQTSFFQAGSRVFKGNSLAQENDKLRENLAKTIVDYTKLDSLITENEYLKRELNFLKGSGYNYQTAEVISKFPLNQQQIIISAGLSSGLKEGLAVTFNQGIIIGKITKVEENSAVVSLLTENNSQLAVTTSTLSGTSGLLKSRAGLSVFMELIPQDKTINENEIVITSGLEIDIPRGLVIGKISQVESNVGQIFKSAKVDLPFDYDSILWVTVIKP